MPFKLTMFWTDALIYILLLTVIIFAVWSSRKEHLRRPWKKVISNRLAVASLIILLLFIFIGLLDSIHYRVLLPSENANGKAYYSTKIESLFDLAISPLGEHYEKTYSAPLATNLYSKQTVRLPDGTDVRIYPRLKYGGKQIKDIQNKTKEDIVSHLLIGLAQGLVFWFLLSSLLIAIITWKSKLKFRNTLHLIAKNKMHVPWRMVFGILFVIVLCVFAGAHLQMEYHLFGTDKVGQDVLYQTLKSIRTGLVIGTLTTLVMLPFAILLGVMAGYFGGIIDDVIQYLYTTLSSIPSVLLIAASILSLQIYVSNHPEVFNSLAIRADVRLLGLCVILGITSWTSLCRILRAETLKLREMDFIEAARSMGIGSFKILSRHIVPNVMHIVLITLVLDFSGLVLAEAVLSYVGVGVDPTTMSWGNMINAARLELARDPIVWWPISAAFIFMFALVLSANLFSDAVREAFDPRRS